MLVLTRFHGEEILIGDNIRVMLVDSNTRKARIGIIAPDNIRIDRKEIRERITKGQHAAKGVAQPAP